MSAPLFTVESTFTFQGRGLALVGITADQWGSVHVGDPLVIQRPDGTTLRTIVRGVEYPPSVKWIGERPAKPRYAVVVTAEDVPVSSVVTIERPSL